MNTQLRETYLSLDEARQRSLRHLEARRDDPSCQPAQFEELSRIFDLQADAAADLARVWACEEDLGPAFHSLAMQYVELRDRARVYSRTPAYR